MPFCAKIACIFGLTMISTTSLAFKFSFFLICALISSVISSSSRIVPHFQSIWWRGRSLHLKYTTAHSRMRHAWFVPHRCDLATINDAFFQDRFKVSSVKRFSSPITAAMHAQMITSSFSFFVSFISCMLASQILERSDKSYRLEPSIDVP
jgi:hypothetical protein